MKSLLAILFSIIALTSAKGQMSIEDVINNKDKNGEILLNQGYRGRLKLLVGKNMADDSIGTDFEFTHASLNDKGTFLEAPMAQAICVGIDVGPNKSSFWSPAAVYSKDLPKIELIASSKTMNSLIKLLGKPRSTGPGLAEGDVKIISVSWHLFTLLEGGSVQVLKVFVISKHEDDQWIITDMMIAQGVFKPTGKRPRLEKEPNKARHGNPH